MTIRYAYQRRGGPLLSWENGPPSQSRAADAKSLGSLGDYSSPPGNSLGLPRGGSPEFLGSSAMPKRLAVGAYGDGNVPSSNPPIGQRGVGNYIATGDDATPGTIPTAAQTAFDTYKRPVASALAAYHGVKRTGSVGWAIVYAVMGYVAPVTTTAVSLAQGFSEKKS